MRIALYAAGLSLALAMAAQAQTSNTPAANPPPDAPAVTAGAVNPPAVDTSATTSPYRTGMVIRDAQGSTVGTVSRVIRTPDGATTISANVDGRNVNLPASALTLGSDGVAVSSLSKAQIAAAIAPPS